MQPAENTGAPIALAWTREVMVQWQKNQAERIFGCYPTFHQVLSSQNEDPREKLAFEFTLGSRDLAEILLKRVKQKQTAKQIPGILFPKEQTSFATEHGEI